MISVVDSIPDRLSEPFILRNAASVLGWPDSHLDLASLDFFISLNSNDTVGVGGYGESDWMCVSEALEMVRRAPLSESERPAYIAGWEYAMGDISSDLECRVPGVKIWEDECYLRCISGDIEKINVLRRLMRWLFIGSKGTSSPGHVDPLGADGWMFLFSGQKKWWVAQRVESNDLKDSQDEVIEKINRLMTNSEKPSINGWCLSIGVQRPGDLIYVPGGCVHGVLNEGEGAHIAISHNWVRDKNLLYKEIEKAQKISRSDRPDDEPDDALLFGLLSIIR